MYLKPSGTHEKLTYLKLFYTSLIKYNVQVSY